MIVTVRRLGRPTLLVKAVDGILGTHSVQAMPVLGGIAPFSVSEGGVEPIAHSLDFTARLLLPSPLVGVPPG